MPQRHIIFGMLAFWAALFLVFCNGALMTWPVVATPGPLLVDQMAAFLGVISPKWQTALCLGLVAVLFTWAAAALSFHDKRGFRDIELVAYLGGMLSFVMILFLGTKVTSGMLLLPILVLVVLSLSMIMSFLMSTDVVDPELDHDALSKSVARAMAMETAHITSLSRISRRTQGGTNQ